ncbi:MAG: HTH domain-containing protein [archaeon]|nr:MAG: HTH domain-containing protein [archaeon]
MDERLREAFTKIKEEMLSLHQEISELKQQISHIYSVLEENQDFDTSPDFDRHFDTSSTDNHTNLRDLALNFQSSIGNEGVSTDRQTDNRHFDTSSTQLKRTSNMVLDLKEFQRKFRNLTQQEFLIFSALYMLSEKKKNITYKDLAEKTRLTESSVRDYVGRIISKGISIIKTKANNKQIILSIPSEFREVATLDVLARIRAEEY